MVIGVCSVRSIEKGTGLRCTVKGMGQCTFSGTTCRWIMESWTRVRETFNVADIKKVSG